MQLLLQQSALNYADSQKVPWHLEKKKNFFYIPRDYNLQNKEKLYLKYLLTD